MECVSSLWNPGFLVSLVVFDVFTELLKPIDKKAKFCYVVPSSIRYGGLGKEVAHEWVALPSMVF